MKWFSPRGAPVLMVVGALAVTTCTAALACSSEKAEAPRGDCPTEPIRVIVTVSPWRDLVERLAGDCASTTTIVAGGAVDPHDFEPTPSDRAQIEDADLRVMNGVGYDHWARLALDATDDPPVVVEAQAVARVDDGEDPHLWYSPEIVAAVADAAGDALRRSMPAAAAYLQSRASAVAEYLSPYRDRIAALHTITRGATYAATEAVFGRLAAALDMLDVTPSGFRRAIKNEADPSPADIAELRAAVNGGEVDVLVMNPQIDNPGTREILDEAAGQGVAIVEISETPEPTDRGFVAWQMRQLSALEVALRG